MNWKYEAIEKLRDYEAKKQAMESIPEEIRELEMALTGIRSAATDGTPVTGGGSGRENAYLNNICKRDELKRARQQAECWVKMVDDALTLLTDEERLVLERFFICPGKGNVDRLCGELGVEKATVYRRRDQALRRFTICLYGITEN